MLEILLTVIPSLCWLAFRCYQLVHTPAERLARKLNVDIPHIPSVCVDQLAASHIVLHWDIEILPDENIFYVLLVNGKDAGTLAQTSVKLCNLEPDSLYRIQILAVNAISNFRSQSPAVYIRTLANKESKNKTQALPFSVAKEVDLPSSSHKSSFTNYSLDLTAAEVARVTDQAVLAEYLYVFQNELSRVTKAIDALLDHQQQEEARLKNDLDAYRKELEEGSDVRAKKGLDVKDLENKKDLLAFEKLKLSKQLRNYETSRNLHVNKLAELRAKAAKLREKHQHVVNTSKAEKTKVDLQIGEIYGEISSNKETIVSLEHRVKELKSERKNVSLMVLSLRSLVDQFVTPPTLPSASEPSETIVGSWEIFTRDNSLTKLGAEVLRKIYGYKPEWAEDFDREIKIVEAMEMSWKDAFRAAIRKFVSVQNSVEMLRASQDKFYEPQKLTDYQASVEFGGFGNAIGKAPIRKKGYVLVDEGSASPSPPPEVSDTWGNNYSQIYEDAKELGSPQYNAVNTNSPNVSVVNSANALNSAIATDFPRDAYQPMHQYSESTGAVYGDGSESVNVSDSNFQSKPLQTNDFVGAQSGFQDQTYRNAYGDANLNDFRYPDTYEANYLQQYPEQYPEQYQEQSNAYQQSNAYEPQLDTSYKNAYVNQPYAENSYENAPFDNANSNGPTFPFSDNAYSMLPLPMGLSGSSASYVQNDLDLTLQLSIPLSSMQQYAQNIRQSFPYDDMYSIRSTTPESYRQPVQPVQPNLWNNASQNNFLDSRRTFLGLSLLPSSGNMELYPLHSQNNIGGAQAPQNQLIQPQIQVPQVTHDSLFNNLMLSSNSSQIPSSSIWLDRPMSTANSHNRTVSSASQLWRTEPARGEGSPSVGVGTDFLPFSPKKDKNEHINTSF